MRSERSAKRYAEYYDTLYPIAYQEALDMKANSYQAEKQAEKQAALNAFRLMCQTDLWFLSEQVFEMPQAKKAGRKLVYEEFHGPLVDELEKDDSSLIWMSRHMLKSTYAELYCVQLILRDPSGVSILLGSMTAGRARSMLRRIKGHLVKPKIVEAFGDVIPTTNVKRWQKNDQDAMTITRDVPDEDGNIRQIPPDGDQIEVFGLDKVIIGKHPSHIVLDDIITDKNTTTAVQIEKAIDNFSAISSVKGIDTIMKIIGTPWHAMDLYHYIIENRIVANPLKIQGAHMEGSSEVIDYPWFTKKFLDQQKKEMRHLYWPQIHLDTRPRENRIFTPPYPEWHEETKPLPQTVEYYFACDPATGFGEDSIGFAIGAIDPSSPSHLYLIEAESLKLKAEEFADWVIPKILFYQPKRMGIELGLQASFEAVIRLKAQEMQRSSGYFPMPELFKITTGGGGGALKKWQKIDNTFGIMLRDKRVLLHRSMRKLKMQMEVFDRNKQKNDDDILDAVSMVIQTIPYFAYGRFMDQGEEDRVVTWEMFKKYLSNNHEGRERVFAN